VKLILDPERPHWVWGDNGGVANGAEVAGSGPAKGLKSAAGLGAIGLSLSGIYAVTGIGIPCPWRSLTHTLCPFCGATTMGAALLRGDVAAAWSANPFVLTLLVALVIACAFWIVELLGGPHARLPRRLSDQRIWYLFLGAAAIAYAVWRNLAPGS